MLCKDYICVTRDVACTSAAYGGRRSADDACTPGKRGGSGWDIGGRSPGRRQFRAAHAEPRLSGGHQPHRLPGAALSHPAAHADLLSRAYGGKRPVADAGRHGHRTLIACAQYSHLAPERCCDDSSPPERRADPGTCLAASCSCPVVTRNHVGGISMLRVDALQAVYPELEERIVVTIMGAVAAELYTLGHRPNFFYLEHAMGLASSMGLGIALSMPECQVIVLDGDGSLLMNLGTLSTMARYKPGNLLHIVFDNESLLSVGGFPTATSTGTDLAGIARASGVPSVMEANTPEGLKESVSEALKSNKLTTIVSKVEAVGPKSFHMDLPLLENRFQFWRCLQTMQKQSESEPYILHITRREQWMEAKQEGYYKGDTLHKASST